MLQKTIIMTEMRVREKIIMPYPMKLPLESSSIMARSLLETALIQS